MLIASVRVLRLLPEFFEAFPEPPNEDLATSSTS